MAELFRYRKLSVLYIGIGIFFPFFSHIGIGKFLFPISIIFRISFEIYRYSDFRYKKVNLLTIIFNYLYIFFNNKKLYIFTILCILYYFKSLIYLLLFNFRKLIWIFNKKKFSTKL